MVATERLYAPNARTRVKAPRIRAEGTDVGPGGRRRDVRRLLTVFVATIAVLTLPLPGHAAMLDGPRLLRPAPHKSQSYPDFRWKAIRGTTEYQLQLAQDRSFAQIVTTVKTSARQYIPSTTLPAAAYWWRVRAVAPVRSRWSPPREMTRRWRVPDTATGNKEAARPEGVTAEDFSSEPGIQAPVNALKISWEPVTDASYYVVQFDKIADADEDVLVTPDYAFVAEAECLTPHTILTPNAERVELPEQGVRLITDPESADCTITPGIWQFRVRAVDQRMDGQGDLYSLWSDEARSANQSAPGAAQITVGGPLAGNAERSPASLTAPANGTTFVDSPVLEWEPKQDPDYPGEPAPFYKVVLALDHDFTTEVGHYHTSNTRLIPLERIPEDNAERAYYWYAVPCTKERVCISSNQVVNREGKFRSFKKISAKPVIHKARSEVRPWTMFSWTHVARTVSTLNRQMGRRADSVGGVKGYEFQVRLPRQGWPETGVKVDVPEYLPTDLGFGVRYQWRIRFVDGSDQPRPWSDRRWAHTPAAAPANPIALRARRHNGRVELNWQRPSSAYFPVESYSVFYSLNGKRWKALSTVVNTRAVYRISARTRYFFMVTANSRGGSSRPSRVVLPR